MTKEIKKDIRKYSLDELGEFFISNGEKAFRSKQVYEWLWKKSVTSFDEMTNLSKKTRSLLIDNFIIKSVKIKQQQKSYDGTIKIVFELYDGKTVEGKRFGSRSRVSLHCGRHGRNRNPGSSLKPTLWALAKYCRQSMPFSGTRPGFLSSPAPACCLRSGAASPSTAH